MEASRPTCFVIMGFGEKETVRGGRALSFDELYQLVIVPAIKEAGLFAMRADVIGSGESIQREVIEQMLHADLVIADLSASSEQTFYLLGLRHGLRPRPTIVIAEEQLTRPFARAQVVTLHYPHGATKTDVEELSEFRTKLGGAISAALAGDEVDSPVYARLPGLRPAGSVDGLVESGKMEEHMIEDIFSPSDEA